MQTPHQRYISFSDDITTRDNNKMVRLVQSPSYRQLRALPDGEAGRAAHVSHRSLDV
jgi:hypothetical protein